MKTYILTTQSMNNEMRLYSTFDLLFETSDLNECLRRFNDEVIALEEACLNVKTLPYTPSDIEIANAIYCEIVEVEEEGEPKTVKRSDYYFEL